MRFPGSADGTMSTSLVERITPWALTASPPIKTKSTPRVGESPEERTDIKRRRHRRDGDMPAASSNAARMSASACSRFSPRLRAPSRRSVSPRAASSAAASRDSRDSRSVVGPLVIGTRHDRSTTRPRNRPLRRTPLAAPPQGTARPRTPADHVRPSAPGSAQQSERRGPSRSLRPPENRGVSGSSPGLAISRLTKRSRQLELLEPCRTIGRTSGAGSG